MKKFILAILATVLAFNLSACGTQDKAAATTNRYAALSDEEQLYLRAMNRWNALIANDMETVYGFASPTYRSTYDFNHFVNQYGGQVKRKRAEVRSVEVAEGKDSAEVKVEVFAESGPMPGTGPIELASISKGTWVKRDGMWWYVEPR